MERTLAKDVANFIDEKVLLEGSISSLRRLGAMTFLVLRDRSGETQIVLDKEVSEKLKSVLNESVVRVTGKVIKEDRAPKGAEMHAEDVEILVPVTEELPIVISKKELNTSLETLLDNRALSLRHPKVRAIFNVQDAVLNVFDSYFRDQGFKEIKTPETIGVASEGGTEVFEIKYFDRKAYLVQSPQLYKQMLVPVFERVFEVSRVFRAELHNTSRHMNESTQLDIEMGFIKDHSDTLREAHGFLTALSNHLTTHMAHEFEELGATIPAIPKEIPSVRLSEAVEILTREYGRKGEVSDLSPEDERNLCEYMAKKLSSDYVFVTHYPDHAKPFYIYNDPEDPKLTRGFDILFRGLEIASGGQRVHEYDALVKKMESRKMNLDHFKGYLEAFKYGMSPHGGWSIGLERITMQLLGLSNVREASLFPRDINRLEP